jgi:hypothetical protein
MARAGQQSFENDCELLIQSPPEASHPSLRLDDPAQHCGREAAVERQRRRFGREIGCNKAPLLQAPNQDLCPFHKLFVQPPHRLRDLPGAVNDIAMA